MTTATCTGCGNSYPLHSFNAEINSAKKDSDEHGDIVVVWVVHVCPFRSCGKTDWFTPEPSIVTGLIKEGVTYLRRDPHSPDIMEGPKPLFLL